MQSSTRSVYTHGSMTVQTRVPTCLLPDYWRRHQLSRKDIDIIASYVPTKVLWMYAMHYDVQCPWYSLRSSASTTPSITLTGKSTVIDIILTHENLTPQNNVNKLDTTSVESFEHIPPIPKYVVTTDEFNDICMGIVSHLMPRCLMEPGDVIDIIPRIHHLNGMVLVPTGIEGTSVCCTVIVRESDYVYKMDGGPTHAPKVGLYQGVVYCLTDELVLLTLDSTGIPGVSPTKSPVS